MFLSSLSNVPWSIINALCCGSYMRRYLMHLIYASFLSQCVRLTRLWGPHTVRGRKHKIIIAAIDSFVYIFECIFFFIIILWIICLIRTNMVTFIVFCYFIMLYLICIGMNSLWFRIILINTLSLGINLIALALWIAFPVNINFLFLSKHCLST